MKANKANSRDKKNRKARYGMRVSNRSIFTVVAVQVKKAKKDK